MNIDKTTTHSSLSFILVFAQCFGMLPVRGITGKSHQDLIFKWTSKKTVYSISFALAATANTVLFLIRMVRYKEFHDWVGFVFFSMTVVTLLIFLDIATKWPRLMKTWTEVDIAMSSYGFPFGLKKKLKIIAAVMITAAIVEHTLFVTVEAGSCQGDTLAEIFAVYFDKRFGYVFNVIPYHFLWGVFFQVLNIFSTVSWNFVDIFIILVSLCLSARYKQVAEKTKTLAVKKVTNQIVWRQLRENYTRVTLLCRTVDNTLSNIILLSFGNNLFVILVQLFNTFQAPPRFGFIDKIYYGYSFGFLIVRVVLVVLFVATVHNESQKPRYHLHHLPHFLWNQEIDRFIYQTRFCTGVLTGHGLFKITSTLLLEITVAIVSYELIFIQYVRIKST